VSPIPPISLLKDIVHRRRNCQEVLMLVVINIGIKNGETKMTLLFNSAYYVQWLQYAAIMRPPICGFVAVLLLLYAYLLTTVVV